MVTLGHDELHAYIIATGLVLLAAWAVAIPNFREQRRMYLESWSEEWQCYEYDCDWFTVAALPPLTTLLWVAFAWTHW